MRIANVKDLGGYIRTCRQQLGLTQAELARKADVSPRWLADLERGKPTVELGLTLRTLQSVGLMLVTRPASAGLREVDLDQLIADMENNRA